MKTADPPKLLFHSNLGKVMSILGNALVICCLSLTGLAKDQKPKAAPPKSSAMSAACHKPKTPEPPLQSVQFQNQAIPDVQVIDQNGKKRNFYSDLIRNKVVVINFIFTSCEALCPMQGKAFAKIQNALSDEKRENLHLISISIDPQKDSPVALKAWSKLFGANDHWTLVTGEKSEIDKVLEAMTGDPSGKREHSSVMIIGNAHTNRWTRTYSFAPPERVFEIVEALSTQAITRP